MSKNNSESVKLTGKITMKNLIYDFSDPANHRIIFPDSERKLEGKSFFSFKSQTSIKNIVLNNDLDSSTGASLAGEFVWLTHPGFNFFFDTASPSSELLIAKCKKIGPEKFYSIDQIVLDNVLVKPDLTVTGNVLVPFASPVPGKFDLQWFDFDGAIINDLLTIVIGEAKWTWSFEQVK